MIERLNRWLEGRSAPALFGLVSALALWWTWGSLNPVEVIHDETAYLLQAGLLAHGHLVGPARPIPAFFEQFQVFAEPAVTAKYPLGFPLALVPGVWLDLPGLVPVLLIGITGALVFALGRRIASPAVGLLAWALWFVAPGSIPFRQLLMSETLTTALWLGGWWCVLEWKERGSTRWLVGFTACAAWCVITRPLTGAAYGAMTGIAVLWIAFREGRTGQLAPATGIAVLILGILPLQNWMVTGSWDETAWTRYTREYAPSDHFGFGSDSTPPLRALPPDFGDYVWYYGEFHKDFTPARAPHFFVERGAKVLEDAWGPAAPVAAIVAGLGLASAGAPLLVACATALLLLLLHLGFAHPPEWSIYYEETLPVITMLTAVGARRVLALLRPAFRTPIVGMLALLLAAEGVYHTREARVNYRLLSEYHRAFRARVAALPGRPLVFVRYARNHIFHRSLISNPGDLATARAWIVYDMGPQNIHLLAITPGRVPWIYFEHGDSLRAWTAADTVNGR
ncbi:MAG TPA: hypothetical protein VMJ30_04795 [Gemmatimonadales bacterium]|nr:hypothetical protein [Gemmatimonadales bacterium]